MRIMDWIVGLGLVLVFGCFLVACETAAPTDRRAQVQAIMQPHVGVLSYADAVSPARPSHAKRYRG